MTNTNNYISARDIAENAKLNHEIAEELKKQSSMSCQCSTLASRSNKDSLATWIPVSGTGMTRIFCLTVFMLLPTLAHAESCVSTPKCEDLGYTASSCPDNKGVRCPWNTSLWHCDSGQKCSDLGFNYTCTGTNEAGGASAACDGKYVICSCAEGYAWDTSSSSCKFQTGLKDGLYYCNDVVKGVQVGSQRLVVALNDLGSMNLSSAKSSCSTYSFCGDTKGVLPTKDQLLKIYNNISTVQSRLSANGGTQFSSTDYWSSSGYYVVNPVSGSTGSYSTSSNYYVRPVLAL